ncbi:WD40 repeat protein [Tieghemiomyces parasiticus]|uniref:WD40 repeat protein n=1 Tax=Tieghemiomyces parasiticus TaxID=78921 RepID=A0A9W8DSM3_9FUNG|nr:WD40 repeat protein [Tieghemiomyces parasiticus]
MYWRLAQPKVLALDEAVRVVGGRSVAQQPLGKPSGRPVLRLAASTDRTLLLAMTCSDVYLWSLQPFALLAVELATTTLIQEVGVFQDVVWQPTHHPHRREFAVVTSHGYVRRYWVVETDRTAYGYAFGTHPHYYVPGPAEEHGIRVYTIRIIRSDRCLPATARLTTVQATDCAILIFVRNPGGVLRIPWSAGDRAGLTAGPASVSPDTPLLEEYETAAKRTASPAYYAAAEWYPVQTMPWLTTADGHVTHAAWDPWSDTWCWVADCGKVCLVRLTPADPSEVSLAPISPLGRSSVNHPAACSKLRWVGTGTLLPNEPPHQNGVPPTISALAVNPPFAMAAVATARGEIFLYAVSARRHDLTFSHWLALPSTGPCQDKSIVTVTALTWSPDGLLLTAITFSGQVYQWTVYGSFIGRFALSASPVSLPFTGPGPHGTTRAVLPAPIFGPWVPINAVPFWDESGTELLLPLAGNAPTQPSPPTVPLALDSLYCCGFARALVATQPSLSNHQRLILQSSWHLIMGPHNLTADPDTTSTTGLPSLSNLADTDPGEPTWPLAPQPFPLLAPHDEVSNSAAAVNRSIGSSNPDLAWQFVPYPPVYLAGNWPIRYTATDAHQRYVAVAGRRGFCYYSRTSHRWKLFGNQAAEQSFRVQGGLAWYHHWLIVICNLHPDADEPDPSFNLPPAAGEDEDVGAAHSTRGEPQSSANPMAYRRTRQRLGLLAQTYQKTELRIYSRVAGGGLGDHNVVLRRALPAPVLRLDVQGDHLLILDSDGHLEEFLLSSPVGRGNPRHRARSMAGGSQPSSTTLTLNHNRRWTVHSIAADPWYIRGFSRSSWHPGGDGIARHLGSPTPLPQPALTIQVGGKLVALLPGTGRHPPTTTARDMAHSMTRPPSRRRSSTTALTAHAVTLARRVEFFVASRLYFPPRAAVAWVLAYDAPVALAEEAQSRKYRPILNLAKATGVDLSDDLARQAVLDELPEADLAGNSTEPAPSITTATTTNATSTIVSSRRATSITPQLRLVLVRPAADEPHGDGGRSPLLPTPVMETLPVTVDFYPLGVVDEQGLVFGMELALEDDDLEGDNMATGAVPSGPLLFDLAKRTQLLVHHVVRYLLAHPARAGNLDVYGSSFAGLHDDLGDEDDDRHDAVATYVDAGTLDDAWAYLAYFERYPYFSHILELLLHIVIEDEASRRVSPTGCDALLPVCTALIRDRYEAYLPEVVVRWARKSEPALWSHLFRALEPPRTFFGRCLAQPGRLRTAAEALIVMQTLLSIDESTECLLRLLKAAVHTRDRVLCKDLVQFLGAIAASDPQLQVTLHSLGIPAASD